MKRLIIINIILLILINVLPSKKNIDILPINNISSAEISENSVEITEITEIPENNTIENNISENITSRSDTPRKSENKLEGYRVTSYYPADNYGTGNKTGSGKTTDNFSIINIEGKNVYTYEGRIVVAGATKELLKSGYNKNGSQNKQDKHYFNYYDTGRIKINDNWYGFIVLDSCGASMWEGYYRLDIFVPNSNNIIDTKNVEIVYD